MRPRFSVLFGLAGLLFTISTAFAAPRIITPDGALPSDAPTIEVVSSGSDGVVLEFRLPAVAVETLQAGGRQFQSVGIPEGGLEGSAGTPGIPTFTRLVQIPDDAAVTISSEAADQQDLQGFDLMPIQPEEGTGLAYDVAAYSRNDFGTALRAEAGAAALCRNLRVVPVTFRPVQYNPAERTLRVSGSIRVDVKFAGHDPTNARTGHVAPITPSFDRLYRHLVVNYQGPAEGDRITSGTWLVICPNDASVVSHLQPLVDWRSRKGYPVRVATTAETGTSADAIKAYLQNAYNSWLTPPEFVVLAGDANGTYSLPTSSRACRATAARETIPTRSWPEEMSFPT